MQVINFSRVVLCLCLTAMLLLAHGGSAGAQQRKKTQPPAGNYLPRAGFGGAYGMPTGPTELPRIDGVHLNEGQYRGSGLREQTSAYDAGEPSLHGALVRWDPRCFPLKVWISDGRKLPDVDFSVIAEHRVPYVSGLLQHPESFAQLPQARNWVPEMNDCVADGFEQWRFMERWFSKTCYGFVDDPTRADVLVFFTDNFVGSDGPGGTSVNGQTYGQVFTPEQVAKKLQLAQPTMPIVVELKCPQVMSEHRRGDEQAVQESGLGPVQQESIKGNAAHEFGHVLGIKAHSPYFDDLMYVNRITTVSPTEGDKSTLKDLYSKVPQYWYYKQMPLQAVQPSATKN